MKLELIETAVDELRLAQSENIAHKPSGSFSSLRMPPALPLKDGMELRATEKLIGAVSEYAVLWRDNQPELKNCLTIKEFRRIVSLAFGEILAKTDLEAPTHKIIDEARKEIDKEIELGVENSDRCVEIVLGCEVLRSNNSYPLEIGPVRFQTRNRWLVSAVAKGDVSDISARRLRKAWEGNRLKKRKPSLDAEKEQSIVDTVGSSTTICTVVCDGLSFDMISEKSLLASRLAMSAISLIWQRPSQGLQWMNLNYDGVFYHRHYVMFGEGGRYGASHSISMLSDGAWTSDEFSERISEYADTLDILGEALKVYVQPNNVYTRPAVLNSLFLSLWWFYEGCRESSDKIATTKFSASLDALSGGKKAKGIVKLIGARIGPQANDKLMNDGRTTKKVVAEVYDAGRSRLMHGSSTDYAQDWVALRATAEVIARLCLLNTTSWLAENPEVKDISLASEP